VTKDAKRPLFKGLNLNSPDQMLKFFHSLGLRPVKTVRNEETGAWYTKPSTSNEALEPYSIDCPKIKHFLDHRQKTKLLTFLEAWPKFIVGDRLFFSLNQHVTATGRLSGSDPNLQQVPRRDKVWGPEFRQLFLPDEGEVCSVTDYSQAEVCLAAHYSNEPVLINALKEGIDYYGIIATKVLGLTCHPNEVKKLHPEVRDVAKVIGLGHALYGMGAFKLAQTIGCSLDDAKDYAKGFARELPVLNEYKYALAAKAQRQGYLVGLFGRKLWFEDDVAKHVPFNHLVQNAASDLTCFTQLQITKRLKGIATLKLLIHDEVLYSHKEEYTQKVHETITHYMVDQYKDLLRVPLRVDISTGESWACKQ